MKKYSYLILAAGFYFLFSSQAYAQDVSGAVSASQDQISHWPWYISRATGILSYILAFIVFVFGIGVYTKKIYGIIRSENAIEIHKYLSISLWAAITIHIFSLLFDGFLKLTLEQLLVPFDAAYKTFDMTLGIFAFYAFLLIIISSLYFRMRHKKIWRKLHYLTYGFFWLALFHGIGIGTDTKTDYMHYVYWITGSIAVFATVYRFWFSYHLNKKGYDYFISDIKSAPGGISMLEIMPAHGEVFDFKPGQYAMLALPDGNGGLTEKHAFSIASSMYQKDRLEFGIKTQGKFTQRVSKMRKGDGLAVYGPFGDFILDGTRSKNIVFIAGGIGITPFMNMIRYATEAKLKNNITLLYSVRNLESTAYLEEIVNLTEKNSRFRPFFFVTEEKVDTGGMLIEGKINERMVLRCIENVDDTIFFLCGPDKFITFLFNMLLDFGVSQSNIRKELFF